MERCRTECGIFFYFMLAVIYNISTKYEKFRETLQTERKKRIKIRMVD